eukprot:288694-Rhodomonas_salina.2
MGREDDFVLLKVSCVIRGENHGRAGFRIAVHGPGLDDGKESSESDSELVRPVPPCSIFFSSRTSIAPVLFLVPFCVSKLLATSRHLHPSPRLETTEGC